MGGWFSWPKSGNEATTVEASSKTESITAINSTVLVYKLENLHQSVHEKLDTVINYGIGFLAFVGLRVSIGFSGSPTMQVLQK